MLSDKAITCVICGKKFTFTVREQESGRFALKPPSCVHCRAFRGGFSGTVKGGEKLYQ